MTKAEANEPSRFSDGDSNAEDLSQAWKDRKIGKSRGDVDSLRFFLSCFVVCLKVVQIVCNRMMAFKRFFPN